MRDSSVSIPVLASLGLALAAGFLSSATPVQAQYFGQNQVRWDRFDFQTIDSERFRIFHYPEAEEAVRDAARMSDRWYERLARAFAYELPERSPLILYADHPDFQQTNIIEGRIGEATGGVTEGLRQRVVMPFTDANADTDHVLGHELVHVFQFSMAGRGPGMGALMRQPLWSVEGLAEYLSVGRADPHTAMWLRDAILRDDFPTIQAMSRDPQRYFPYRFGHAFWAYVAGRWSDELATRAFRTSLQRGIAQAVEETFGTPRDSLNAEWEEATRAAFLPAMEGRVAPEEMGRPVLTRETTGGNLNLAPSISPDGRLVAFLSERGLFSIELWLADVETGEVVRRLVSTETDPHFDALAFVHSGGTWSPGGERLAFVVFARGENRIVTVDGETGRGRREIAVPGVGAIHHPSWSPDGTRIAFSGQSGGRTDLWVVDVETGESERLTDDAYSVLHPAWSPDGNEIVFVTERGEGTDLARLQFGPLRLASMDLGTGRVEVIRPFPSGKAINPAFSPDGGSIYFIADPDGFSDIYRMDRATGGLYRVTRIVTGISGLTDRSAALSVAADDGRLAYSVFTDGNYAVHTLPAEEAQGEPVAPAQIAAALPGALPPLDRAGEGFVMGYLADPDMGLTPRPTEEARPYRASLGLEMIAPVQIGVGVDQFGAAAGGSVAALFSDMMREQLVQVAVQAQGEVRDIGGQVLYQNQRGRWTWGAAAGRIPYRTGFTMVGVGPGGTQEVTQILQRVTSHQAVGLASYPFSRVLRTELGIGVNRLGYDAERWTWQVLGGRIVDVIREDAPEFEPDGITQYQGTAALVGDNSVFGLSSPVRGQRWRLEAQQNLGSLRYTTGLGDYRRYFFGRPTTVAVRGIHFGRYGPDAEDERLSPLFLGFEPLIRGYATGTFRATECTPANDGTCPEFNRLFGSRMAVANLEVRTPIFGVEGYGLFDRGPFPLEIAAFLDAGAAWTSFDSVDLTWERRSPDRIPVFSTGLTSRIGLGPYIALEVYYVYPFQRPERGGHFGFQLAPGW